MKTDMNMPNEFHTTSSSMEHLENPRRDFLRWMAVAAGGSVLTQFSGCGGGSSSSSTGGSSNAYVEPVTIRSTNRLLTMDLIAEYSAQPIAVGAVNNSGSYPSLKTNINTNLRRYSGSFPAPTLRVRAGDTIRIRLINRLPPNPPGQSLLSFLSYQNNTNLHFHGLHVSPKMVVRNGQEVYGDYVVDAPEAGVAPGSERLHEIVIPADHAPGIFWYHPHLHGSSGAQVSSGMFGAIIVEGSTNEYFDPQLATERVMFMHKHNFSSSGTTNTFAEAAVPEPTAFLINGVSQPTIVMRPGEVQVWHFINSATFYPFNIYLEGHTLQAFARDGDPIPEGFRPVTAESAARFTNPTWASNIQGWPGTFASSGSRISVIVKASDTPGDYSLRSLTSPWTTNVNIPVYEEVVARVQVQGEPVQTPMPTRSNFIPHADFAPITDQELAARGGQRRNLVLGVFPVGASPSRLPPSFPAGEEWTMPLSEGGTLFSGLVFAVGDNQDPSSTVYPFQSRSALSQTVRLGDVEEWTIATADGFPHPFHMHINDMYVVRVNDVVLEAPYWADTLTIPPRGSVTFRTRFKDFDGSFVWHCHILEHEDLGMMQLVTVV